MTVFRTANLRKFFFAVHVVAKELIVFLQSVAYLLRKCREQTVQSSVSCEVMLHPEVVKLIEVGKFRAHFCLTIKWFSLRQEMQIQKIIFDYDAMMTLRILF